MMRSIKYNIFYLLFIFPGSFLHAQTQGSKGKQIQAVSLLTNSFVCRACEVSPAKPTISSMNQEIVAEQTLESAAKKIARHFSAPGDQFLLFCRNCPGKQMMGYPIRSSTQPNKASRGFGTYIYSKPIVPQNGKTKGGNTFYRFSEILDYCNQGLFLFDSVQLSTAAIMNDNNVQFGSLRVYFDFKGTSIEREIPYDEATKSYLISYRILFGNKLPREMTDSLTIGLSYQYGNDQTVRMPGGFKMFFANEVEKEDLAALFKMYKDAFPEWKIEAIAEQLMILVQAKYKAVSPDNFTEWLQKLP